MGSIPKEIRSMSEIEWPVVARKWDGLLHLRDCDFSSAGLCSVNICEVDVVLSLTILHSVTNVKICRTTSNVFCNFTHFSYVEHVLTLSGPGGGGEGRKVPALISTFENFLAIQQYRRNFAILLKSIGKQLGFRNWKIFVKGILVAMATRFSTLCLVKF